MSLHLRLFPLLLLLAACRVGPDYEGPPTEGLDLPDSFGEIQDPAYVPGKTDLRSWWKVFDDPMLDELIQRAASDNRDLRIALSRVNEARSRAGIVRSQSAPQIGFGGGVARANELATGFETRTVANAGLNASWELDVFGRIAREVEAAEADYEATEEDRRDVQVSLFAEVARAYLSVRALQAQLDAAQRNITSQTEVVDLTEVRLGDGVGSQLEVAQARQVLATSQAAVPPLRIQLSSEINTIAVLVGTHPQALHVDLETPQPIPVPPETVTVDVPAEVLRQRPDVRAAERRLAAATARVGVAAADLYPSFSLDGNLGFRALDGQNLLDAGSRTFALGPSFRWNLYDGGRIRSQIDVASAQVDQAVLLYESAVLSALEEVETTMTTFTEQRERLKAVEAAAEASRETLRLATELYRDGLSDFQQVLDAQRQTLATESQVAEASGLASESLVSLYKALGGGWDPSELAEEEAREAAEAAPGEAAPPAQDAAASDG